MDENPKQTVDNLICKVNYDYQDIKYSVYRVAMKLCHLQHHFKLDSIHHQFIKDSFDKFIQKRFGKSLHIVVEEALTLEELASIISNIYKLSGTNVADLTETFSHLIFNTFMDIRQNVVGILPCLQFLLVMGSESMKNKYKIIFDLYSGSLKVMSRSRLSLCLTHFVRITDIVSESGNFSRIKPAVDSCFEGVLGSSISENHFLEWLEMEPQSVVWLPTMHRLNISKTSIHNVQCATCKVRPIVGLRFQCLRCLDYNSCQVCFLTRKCVTRSHRLTHPRQEYCLPAGSKQKVNALARTVRNIVTKRYKRKALSSGFLPIQQQGESVEDDVVPSNFDDVNNLADQEKQELEKLVTKLKDENEKMSGTVDMLETSKNEVVKLDEERVLLQSELDTVNLHNRNLKAELDNLKCVVFADSFADDEADETLDERSSLSTSYVDESIEIIPEADGYKMQDMNQNEEPEVLLEKKFENPFLLHADALLLSMDNEEQTTCNRGLVLMAAAKVSENFCDVIDCALDIV